MKLKSHSDIQAEQTSLFTAKGFLHGGRRPGAGRPKVSDKRSYSFWCSPSEYAELKSCLEKLRAGQMHEKNCETTSPQR